MRKISDSTIGIITSVVCIILIEICLGFFAPITDPYRGYKNIEKSQYIVSEFPTNFKFKTLAEESLPGVNGVNLFSTNNMGFRGDRMDIPKPDNEFRVFMIGGSTTECLYLDDTQAINSVLQSELNKLVNHGLTVKVYGAGKSGDASPDHISMIVHRVIHLQPDMLIVFMGINDLMRSINSYDYLHYSSKEETKYTPLLLCKMMATESQILRRLYYLIKRYKTDPAERRELITRESDYKEKVELCKSIPVSGKKPAMNLAAYRNNLVTIAGVAKAHGVPLVLMTQQTTWNSSVDPKVEDWQWILYSGSEKYSVDSMNESMESLNSVMRQVAAEYSIPIFDTAKRIPKSLEFFYDDVHFNVKGAYTAGSELANFIYENNLITLKNVH